MIMKIGKYLSLDEIKKSAYAIRHGIANEPAGEQISNIVRLAVNVYDEVCDHFGIKIPFSSWYRNDAVNRGINGSKNSQHITGEAVDLDVDCSGLSITNSQIFFFIMNNLEFDQLIWEYGNDDEPAWVHVSYTSHRANRKIVMRKRFNQPYVIFNT